MFWLFVICSKLLILSLSQSVSPNWTETSSISAGTKVLFTSLAAAGTTQSFFVLYSTMLSTNPYLAYGLKKYRGSSLFIQLKIISCNNILQWSIQLKTSCHLLYRYHLLGLPICSTTKYRTSPLIQPFILTISMLSHKSLLILTLYWYIIYDLDQFLDSFGFITVSLRRSGLYK